MVVAAPVADPPRPRDVRSLDRSVRSRLSPLFPAVTAGPVRWWQVGLGALAVLVGAVVSLGRTTGTGPFQSIWEEDARDLLTDALTRPGVPTLVRPFVGYFQVGPRIMAELASHLPIRWAAAALSIEAALTCALLALVVYVASGPHLRSPFARFLVAAPMLAAPTAENFLTEIYNRPACVQFFVAYAMFWMVLWTPRRSPAQLLLVGVVWLAGVSTFLTVLFVPLALVRLYVKRDLLSTALVGCLVFGGTIQELGIRLGLTNRDFAPPKYDPIWALSGFVSWGIPHSILGWHLALGTGEKYTKPAIILLAWLVIVAVIVVAALRFTRPAWLLAACAGVQAVLAFCMMVMASGGLIHRYLLPVEMMVFSALVALLLPTQRSGRNAWLRSHLPLAVLAVLIAGVCIANYRFYDTWRNRAPKWTDQVAAAAVKCRTERLVWISVRSGPEPYYSLVTVPCRVLTGQR